MIPPDGSGGSGDGGGSDNPDYSSALSQIGSMLTDLRKTVGDGVGTVVNNINYQTAQITNTITNTVTNMTQQITQGLTDVKQGISDKLQSVQQGITDKLGQVQEGINNKLEDVQEEIVNGYDDSSMNEQNNELSGVLDALDDAEQEVLDDVNGYIEGFEYPSFDGIPSGIIGSLSFFGGFLHSIFLGMGEFGLIITFSLTMIFVLIIVGYHRIRS